MRKLILFLTLALLVTAFAVPTFASDNSDIVCQIPFSTGFGSDMTVVPFGTYEVELFVQEHMVFSGTFTLSEYPFEYSAQVDYGNESCWLVINFADWGTECHIWDSDYVDRVSYDGVVFISLPAPESDQVPVTDGLFTVFTAIGAYLISGLTSLLALFWTGTSLTFLGALAVCALSIAIILLLVILIIRNAGGY